jgi:hypothetical protein
MNATLHDHTVENRDACFRQPGFYVRERMLESLKPMANLEITGRQVETDAINRW